MLTEITASIFLYGISPLPCVENYPDKKIGRSTVKQLYDYRFTKYTWIETPNGGKIYIVAQQGIKDISIARARNLMKFYLTPVPDSVFGTIQIKENIANEMADRGAMLMMPEGRHDEENEPNLPAQPLYDFENPIEGSNWYINNNWQNRDAAFEEIFHLIHDEGIGTNHTGVLPGYQKLISLEAQKALKDKRWGISIDPYVQTWIKELHNENSLAQEYIASVIDSYYGLWAAFEKSGGMWGIYIAKTRKEITEKDPNGQKLIEAFLPKMMFGYESLVDPEFSGTFIMELDKTKPWTHKSQYLVEVTLTGNLNSNISGNNINNIFKGNSGNNVIDGKSGADLVFFKGKYSEYEVNKIRDKIIVRDLNQMRDGTDTLINIEEIKFSDKLIQTSVLSESNLEI